MPMPLSRNDARRAAMGCRALAVRNRQDAEVITDDVVRDALVKGAEKLEELAARFEAYAMAGPG
jgi:hypothetical protein